MSTPSFEIEKLANAQRRLLRQTPPEVPGYEIAFAYRPSYMATGDYHDFFYRWDGRWATFVGDGSHHGPSASILMATMRAILNTHPNIHRAPGRTLTFAGNMFHRLAASDLFMTAVYAVLDQSGWISWAAAGQDPPIRVDPYGIANEPDLRPVGMPLGVEPKEEFATVSWQLTAGETIVIFTDGLVEACNRDGQQFGRDRLRSALEELAPLSPRAAIDEVVRRVGIHLEGADFEDDFTILAIRRLKTDSNTEPECRPTHLPLASPGVHKMSVSSGGNFVVLNDKRGVRIARFIRPDVRDQLKEEPIDATGLFRDFQENVLGEAGEGAKIVFNIGLLEPRGISAICRFLLKVREVVHGGNGDVAICGAKPDMKKALVDLFNFDKAFGFHESEEGAVRSLSGES